MFSQSIDGVDWSKAAVVTTYKGYLDLNGLVVSYDNRALVFWIEYEGNAPADLRWSQGR
jgi:hypothetical protein